MSEREFRYARDRIATKIMAGDSLNDVLSSKKVNAMVIYYTDKHHVTWYTINEALCNELIDKLYDDSNSEAELQNVIQDKNDKTQFIYPTETTTKNVEDELFEEELETQENVLDKATKRKRKVATTIPDEFPLPDSGGVPEFLEMFKSDIDPAALEYERKAFIAYWKSTGEKKKDWPKTFRNRLDTLLKQGKLKKGATRNVEGSNRKVSQASIERTAELKRRESIDIFADVTD
jgi:actin-related protein